MPNVSKITLDNTTYDVKDANARKYIVQIDEEPTDATKVVIETTDEEIEFATVVELNTAINGEASERTAGDNALNTRISNIVAQAGTDNTEIVDARTEKFNSDAGPVTRTYTTLKDRLDTEFNAAHNWVKATNNDVADLKSHLQKITGASVIKFTSGFYIATNKSIGSTVDLTPVANSLITYAIVDCVAGDTFILNARGWTTGRLYAFLDNDNKLLSVAAASTEAANFIITAPANAVKAVFNSMVARLGDCFKGTTVPAISRSIKLAESIVFQTVKHFEQGTINSSGVPVANSNTVRTADYIPLKSLFKINIGLDNYFYLRLYDDYNNYVASITTFFNGMSYPSNDITYDTIKTQYPNASKLKITIHGSTAVTMANIQNTGIEILVYPVESESVLVDVNGGGDYTSILQALKSTYPTTKVYVKPGVYNIVNEYSDYYGASFWDNYSGFNGQADNFLRGLYVSDGRVLEFESGAIVRFNYSGGNTNVPYYFSILATGQDATIIGGYIDYGNGLAEYAIHDDNATKGGTNTYKGIIIDGVPSGRGGNHIGGGCGLNNTYILEDIIFLDTSMPDNFGDMYYHNNISANAENRIFVKNCRGLRGCTFRYYGASTKLTYCIASGNEFRRIALRQHTTDGDSPNENMVLVKYNNTETE